MAETFTTESLLKKIMGNIETMNAPEEPIFSALPRRVATTTTEETEDVPPLLKLIGRGAESEGPKSFDEFLRARQTPAQSVIDSIRTAFLASATGQKIKSQRDEFFEEFQLEQQKKAQAQKEFGQNVRVWTEIRSRERAAAKAETLRFALAELNMVDNARDRKARAQQLQTEFGIDVLKFLRDNEEFETQQEELPSSMHETFRKVVMKENPGLIENDPKKFFETVEARVNSALLKEAMAKRKAEPGDAPTDPGTVESLARTIAEGGPIAQMRMVYKGTDAFPKAIQFLSENHMIHRDKAFNKAIADAEAGINILNQVHDLAMEARRIIADRGSGGFTRLTRDSEGLVGRLNGWLVDLAGRVGEEPAARVLSSFVQGPVARRMAKAAGEGSRISDQDALAFVRSLPEVTNTPGEIERLTVENKKVILSQMKDLIQGQEQFGGPNKNPKARRLSFEQFNSMFAEFKRKEPGTSMHDFLIQLIEHGHNLDF